MYERKNVRTNERTDGRIDEVRTNGRTNEVRTKERMNERSTNGRTNERANGRMNLPTRIRIFFFNGVLKVIRQILWFWFYDTQFVRLFFAGCFLLLPREKEKPDTQAKSSPLVPTRCLLFLATNGNLTLLFFSRE